MNRQAVIYLTAAAAALLLAGLIWGKAWIGWSAPGAMVSVGSQANAEVGDATIDDYNDAAIHFIALDGDGAGITTLAPAGHTGDGMSIIPLPPGWTLETSQVGMGGCGLAATHFYSAENGRYRISVVSGSETHGACPWRADDYVYHLAINAGGFQGATIGKITIKGGAAWSPDAASEPEAPTP